MHLWLLSLRNGIFGECDMLIVQHIFLPVEILLNAIIEEYLLSSNCLTIISEQSLYLNIPNPYIYIVPKYNDLNSTLSEKLLEASEAGCSDYIVQIKEPERFFVALELNTHIGNVRRSDRKIILLPVTDLSFRESNNKLLDVLKMKETSFIPNVLLVLHDKNEELCTYYDLVTHKYVGTSNNDQPLHLSKWDSCSNILDKNINLFPNDMSNLQGKEVKVTAFTYKPYVLLDLDTTLVSSGRDGIEIRLIDEFCRWINCTIVLVGDNGKMWGEVYGNGTGTGVLGNVLGDHADIGITALYSWYEEYVIMDFSNTIIRTGITCIAPSPRLLATWWMPFTPFTITMWIGLLLTFLYASIALIVGQGFSCHKIFLTTFGIMISQSQPERGFSSWRTRSVVGWMLLCGLVLDNAYGGGLASTFTVPKYEKSVDTIRDVVDRRLEWGATHDAWIYSMILSQEPLIKKLISLFHTYPADELKRRSFTRSIAFSIEKLPAGYFAIGEYITKEASLDYTTMIEDFYYEQCIAMMRKSSPYTTKISDFIGRLHQSGLLLAWETQVALKYLDYKVQIEVRLSRSKHDVENIQPLGLRHVQGIFFIYAFGTITAVVIFLFEVIKVNKVKLPSK